MKSEAAQIFYHSRMSELTLMLRALCVRDLPILAYHRIYDVVDEAKYPFDIDLISASSAQFRWQMNYIKRHFTPINFGILVAATEGKAKLPRRPIIVTFDDGFEDNYTHAFPILKEFDVPATVFLSTGYIGQPGTYWWDRLAYIINHIPPCTLSIPEFKFAITVGGDIAARRRGLHDFIWNVKYLSNPARIRVCAEMDELYGSYFVGEDLHMSRPMNWDQVREMAAAGIEFGSHTVTHPVLTSLTPAEIRHELAESKREIENRLQTSCDVISYPVGRSFAFDDNITVIARECGYRLGVSYCRGGNNMQTLEPFGLRRVSVERFVKPAQFSSMLSLPELFLA